MSSKLPRPKRNLLPKGRKHPLILAFLLAAGGTTKTTTTIMLGCILALRGYRVRIFDLDAQCNASEIANRGPADLKAGVPTVWDVITGAATLDEATVGALMWNGEMPEGWDAEVHGEWEEYLEIPNLYIVPGDDRMKNIEKHFTNSPADFNWLWDQIMKYRTGELTAEENEVWLFDLPANYGQITLSTLIAMDEDDEVVPPVLVTGKEAKQLEKLLTELHEVAHLYRNKSVPARPTVHNILLCGTPTASHNAAEYQRTVDEIEEAHGDRVLPHVRYSGVAAGQYRQKAPVAISDPKSRPSEDYNDVADCLGFPDLMPEGAS
ncbi:ParA family protein [Streptomyces sp. NPDC088915]|uniref:ParA family protein n=1 Tax=Streptomyces sp. NPDC088915 TaxID=3365912 RepID=UPI0037F49D16